MARTKNRGGGSGSRGGRGRGGRGRGGGGPHYFSQNPDPPENSHRGFSLADEAKNTERHHGNYGASPLRHSKISFVAAGHLDSTDLFKPLVTDGPRPQTERTLDSADETEREEGDDPMASEGPSDSPLEVSTGVLPQDVDMENLDLDPPDPPAFVATTAQSPKKQVSAQGFVVDTIGDPSLRPKGQVPVQVARSPSPGSESSSGSEKIVFVPRQMRPRPVAPRTGSSMKSRATLRIPSPQQPTPREQSPLPIETIKTTTSFITIDDPPPAFAATAAVERELEDAPILENPFPVSFTGRATQGNKRRRRRKKKKSSSDDDDAIIEDYIENVAETMRVEAAEAAAAAHALGIAEASIAPDITTSRANRRDLGAEDSWSSTDSDEAAEDSDAVNTYKHDQLWEEHGLADFDDISTSSEGPKGAVHAVLGKRARPSGTQYLVQWEGFGVDDAAWVLAETLDSNADTKIEAYEVTLAADSSDDDNDDENSDDEEDDEDEENVDGDHKLARLLQRQEALGITDSDLELNIELDTLMELDPAAYARVSGKKKKGRYTFLPEIAPNAATGFYPSASRFADAYDDFDLMDRDRPSLARKKKQKKGKGKEKVFVPDLSDEEQQTVLRNSWMKDREKKKIRKAEREVLRAEGLLGRGKRDLKAKYKEGISMEEVQKAIREFLVGSDESIKFPPMDKSTRKEIHLIAAAFGLKSKSSGSGKTRFPMLYKTARTVPFPSEASIQAAMTNRRFLNRPIGRGGPARPGKGGGGGGGVVHHREGDIVGASAPEIGVENRGRRMLEKMGYVAGMSLGLEGREGIVKPVEAVVKISKAGLG